MARCESCHERSESGKCKNDSEVDTYRPFRLLPKFKDRAWITTSGYDVLRIETDLVAPIPNINLQREHQVINYAPAEFPKRHVRLWLPESTSLYIAYRGRRYERVLNFRSFRLIRLKQSRSHHRQSSAIRWRISPSLRSGSTSGKAKHADEPLISAQSIYPF